LMEYQHDLNRHAKGSMADAFRIIRTNIYCCNEEEQFKTIMFTSALSGEGKSTIAANTAIAYAQLGKKVIMVDCNLHRPVQDKLLGVENCVKNLGVADALGQGVPINEIIRDTNTINLKLISSGYLPFNPAEILASSKMEEYLEYLKSQADIVIIDTPAVAFATDACVLAAKTDGIIMVINVKLSKPEVIRNAKQALVKANGQLLGVILNCVKLTEGHH